MNPTLLDEDAGDHGRLAYPLLEKCLDVTLTLPESWDYSDEQIGCLMLSQELMVPIGIFALLESGCTSALRRGDVLYGVEPDATDLDIAEFINVYGPMRGYAYQGTAGTLADGVLVISDLANGTVGFADSLMAYHGKPLRPPQHPDWHGREVFKGEARHLA